MRLKRPEDERWGESLRRFLAVKTLFSRMSSSKNFQGAYRQRYPALQKVCAKSAHQSAIVEYSLQPGHAARLSVHCRASNSKEMCSTMSKSSRYA